LEACSYCILKVRKKRIAREPGASNRSGSPLPSGLPSNSARERRGRFFVLTLTEREIERKQEEWVRHCLVATFWPSANLLTSTINDNIFAVPGKEVFSGTEQTTVYNERAMQILRHF